MEKEELELRHYDDILEKNTCKPVTVRSKAKCLLKGEA